MIQKIAYFIYKEKYSNISHFFLKGKNYVIFLSKIAKGLARFVFLGREKN
jgi:hypothetical protein